MSAGKGYRYANPDYARWDDDTPGTLIGKLYASFDDGEGEVTLSLKVDGESAMWRVDVLKDIIGLLESEYASAYKEMRAQFDKIYAEGLEKRDRVG